MALSICRAWLHVSIYGSMYSWLHVSIYGSMYPWLAVVRHEATVADLRLAARATEARAVVGVTHGEEARLHRVRVRVRVEEARLHGKRRHGECGHSKCDHGEV